MIQDAGTLDPLVSLHIMRLFQVHRTAALHMQMRCVGVRVGTDVQALQATSATESDLNQCKRHLSNHLCKTCLPGIEDVEHVRGWWNKHDGQDCTSWLLALRSADSRTLKHVVSRCYLMVSYGFGRKFLDS